MAQQENKTLEVSMIVSKQTVAASSFSNVLQMIYFFRTLPLPMCPDCKDDMADYEHILEALTKQKIHRTSIFCKLLKLVKEEHLKTATELVHEYIKDPEDLYEKLI